MIGEELFVLVEMFFSITNKFKRFNHSIKIKCLILIVVFLFFGGCDVAPKADYLLCNFPQLNKKEQRVYYIEWGNLGTSSYRDSVVVFSDAQIEEQLQVYLYMVADVDGELFEYTLGKFEKNVIQNGNLILNDINNDGIDEVVFYAEKNGNGHTIAGVFEIENNEIVLCKDLNLFPNDFICQSLPDYFISIENSSIGFEQKFNIASKITSDAFDSNGVLKFSPSIEIGPIDFIEINDIDDGRNEIICSCSVTLDSCYIGDFYFVYAYDNISHDILLLNVFTDQSGRQSGKGNTGE